MQTLSAQLTDFLFWTAFTRVVLRHRGDHRASYRSCPSPLSRKSI